MCVVNAYKSSGISALKAIDTRNIRQPVRLHPICFALCVLFRASFFLYCLLLHPKIKSFASAFTPFYHKMKEKRHKKKTCSVHDMHGDSNIHRFE